MSTGEEDGSEQHLAEERMKEIKEHLDKEDDDLKGLDEEIQKAVQKSKKVIRDPEP